MPYIGDIEVSEEGLAAGIKYLEDGLEDDFRNGALNRDMYATRFQDIAPTLPGFVPWHYDPYLYSIGHQGRNHGQMSPHR